MLRIPIARNLQNQRIEAGLLVRNSVFNFLAQIAPLLVTFFTMPFILRAWGLPRFGLLSLVWVVLGYCTFFDLGLGRAVTKHVAEALGKNERFRVSRLVWTSAAALGIVGAISSICLLLLVPLLTGRVLKIPPELVGEATLTFYLIAPAIPLLLVSSVFTGALEAAQRFDLSNAVKLPLNICINLLFLTGVLLKFHLPGVVLLHLAARLVGCGAFVVLALSAIPELQQLALSASEMRYLLPFGGWMTALSVLAPLLSYADRLILGSVGSMVLVSYYTVPFDLILRLWIIPSSILSALFPAFSLLGEARKDELKALFLRSTKYFLLTAAPLFLFLMFFGKTALTLWLGAAFAQNSAPVLRILTAGACLGLLAPLSNSLLQGLGRADILPKIYIVYSLPYLAGTWYLVSTHGIRGAAAAAALRSLVDTLLLFSLALRTLSLSLTDLRQARLEKTVGLLAGVSFLFWIFSIVCSSPWLQGAIDVMVGLALGLAVWGWLFDDLERAALVKTFEGTPVFGAPILWALRQVKFGAAGMASIVEKPRVARLQSASLAQKHPQTAKRLIVLFTPGQDWVTGGILSIKSIYEESLKLKSIHQAEVVRCTVPGEPTILKYTKFSDSGHLFTLSQVLAHFRNVESILFHIPEYAISAFLDHCSPAVWNRPGATISVQFNILIQNIRHFDKVPVHELNRLARLGKVTGTTAHAAYSKTVAQQAGFPVHWLSVYVSPQQYDKRPYLNKEDRIIVSPDHHPLKEQILKSLQAALPKLEQQIIRGLNYETYISIIARSKWSLTFGEGLDGYFVEPIFSGAVAFAVYNTQFFTHEFKGLKTVYPNYETLAQKLVDDIRMLDEHSRYAAYQNEQYNICCARYDEREYLANLKNFYATYYSDHHEVTR